MSTTLLASTGLTFGTSSSLYYYSLQAGIIDQTQCSLLVTAVILSVLAPTVIASRFFDPYPARGQRVRAEASTRRGQRDGPGGGPRTVHGPGGETVAEAT